MTTERDYQLIPCPGCGVVNPNSWDDHDLSCPQMPDNIELIAERDSLRAQLSQLHAAGMPTNIDSAVVWIDRLVAKCVDSDAIAAENETLRARVADLKTDKHNEHSAAERHFRQRDDALDALRALRAQVAPLQEQLRLATIHGFSSEAEANDLSEQITLINELQLVEQREHAARVAELEADRDRLRVGLRRVLEDVPWHWNNTRRIINEVLDGRAARAKETTP